MTAETIEAEQFTPAFGAFVDIFEKAGTPSSKAKTMVGVEKRKFDEPERKLFDEFITQFITHHCHEIDTKTLDSIINACSDIEHCDYTNVPLPFNEIETTEDNFIKFNQ